jgi:hypothetical protein
MKPLATALDSSQINRPFTDEDKKVVDDISRKPMDAWTSMDKLALLGIATLATRSKQRPEGNKDG